MVQTLNGMFSYRSLTGCFGTEALRDVLVQRLNGMFWYRGLMGCFGTEA